MFVFQIMVGDKEEHKNSHVVALQEGMKIRQTVNEDIGKCRGFIESVEDIKGSQKLKQLGTDFQEKINGIVANYKKAGLWEDAGAKFSVNFLQMKFEGAVIEWLRKNDTNFQNLGDALENKAAGMSTKEMQDRMQERMKIVASYAGKHHWD